MQLFLKWRRLEMAAMEQHALVQATSYKVKCLPCGSPPLECSCCQSGDGWKWLPWSSTPWCKQQAIKLNAFLVVLLPLNAASVKVETAGNGCHGAARPGASS